MAMYQKNPFPQPGAVDESRMMLLEQGKMEMNSLSTLFSSLSTSCSTKCVVPGKGQSEELTTGEQACLDRCVIKFMETQSFVGQVLQKKTESQMQLQFMQNPAMGAPGMAPPQ